MPFDGTNPRILVKLISEAKYFEPFDSKNKSGEHIFPKFKFKNLELKMEF